MSTEKKWKHNKDAFAKSRFCSIREHVGRTQDVSRFSGTKTRYNALKQLAFLNAEHLKRFSPKTLNLVHKTLFASLSIKKAYKLLHTVSKGNFTAKRENNAR